MIRRTLLFPLTSLGLFGALVLLLAGSNLYTFHRLTDESPIAELQFRKTGVEQYEATIAYGDFCHPEKFLLHGNQWHLDARFLKWHPWANLLGFDSMYRIERLGGRYLDVQDENVGPHLSYQLYEEGGIDLPAILHGYGGRFSPVDTLYGSSVYELMQEGFLYRVYRAQSGLLVRSSAQVDTSRSGSGLTIEISKACGERPGWFSRLQGMRASWF
jgi:hypothetical protein